MTKLPRREYLQQAHKYQGLINIAGFYASEKLDGYRAFWDGGLSRGHRVKDIPYAAKTIVSSGKPKPHLDREATGLWTRYGNPIWAPDCFLNQLPCCPLDGELWLGRGNFQKVSKTCKRNEPDEASWANVEYKVFGSPNPHLVFRDGLIKNNNINLEIRQQEVIDWVASIRDNPKTVVDLDDWKVVDGNFIHELAFLNEALSGFPDGPASLHLQTILSDDNETAVRQLDEMTAKVVDEGGEGMVVRDPHKVWQPKRVPHVLKCKPCEDDEGTIVGFTSGEETDKGSKLLGKIGAIILEYNGQEFKLSGFTDEEREFSTKFESSCAAEKPGQRMPKDFRGKYFKVGDQITFKYRELSDDGVPKEARYFRKREE